MCYKLERKDDEQLWFQLRADIWGSKFEPRAKEPECVDKMLDDFRTGVERLCRPTISASKARRSSRWL